jgi:hypothetical protein
MLTINDVKQGDTVKVRSSFGGGPVVTGVVSGVFADIKRGYPGIDYKLNGCEDPASERWAYLDQVDEVVKNK